MQPGKMHSLLKRQLKRSFGDSFEMPEAWKSFIDMVDSAYHESDMDRNMLERSLELSSQELLQTNSEMRAIFEVVPDIFFRVDASGKILDCKTGNTSDLPFSREDMLGRKIFDIPLAPIAGKFRKALEDVRRTHAAVSFEYSLLLHDTEIFCEARLIPLLEDQAIIIIRNITDLKDAESAPKKSEEYFREITVNSSDVLFIVDARGMITYVSPSVERLTGYSPDELINKNSLFLIAPDDHARAYEDFGKALLTQEVSIPNNFRIRHKNGNEIIMEGVGKNLLHNPAIAGFVMNVRDVTDHKRAEEALLASEEHYRTIFESTATANIIITEDSTILMANNNFAVLSGYAKQELEGKISWTIFIHKDDLEKMKAYHKMRRLIDGSAPPSYEFRFINRKGEIRELFISVAIIPGTKESIASLIDITKRKQLETQLIQAQKMESVGRLAGGVAHDFNNMLSVIIGNTEMAMKKVKPSEPLYRSLQEVLNAGLKSSDLTRQLLAFARKQTVSPKVLDLNDIVTGMLKMLRRLIGEDIDLGWHPGHKLWKVKIDPSQVDQLLANLMVNARDAIAKTGRIAIETSNKTCDEAFCKDQPESIPGEYVMLIVSDNGSGMEKETLANIFEPFFTTKQEGQGTGLGLATVYGIVRQNSGFINVYSEPGQGTAFKIYLPRYVDENVESEDDKPEPAVQGGTETVMLVEDSETVLKICKTMLETLGYQVLAASSKDQALRLVSEYDGNIDLLLTDVVMPDMNGKELSERIIATRPGLKCLYMSGYTADVIARQGILDEGIQFIAKPFSLKDLAVKVREALG